MSVTRWTPEQIESMLNTVGLTRARLEATLRELGPDPLPPKLRPAWTPERPFTNYCYRVAEAAWRSGVIPDGYRPTRKADAEGSHYFFQHTETGAVLDLSAAQFPDGYDYEGGKARAFMPQVSTGARMLAKALGWTIPDPKS